MAKTKAPARKMVKITMASPDGALAGTGSIMTFRTDSLTYSIWANDDSDESRDAILNAVLSAMQAGTVYQIDANMWVNGKLIVSAKRIG